jgi:hypothetical protein
MTQASSHSNATVNWCMACANDWSYSLCESALPTLHIPCKILCMPIADKLACRHLSRGQFLRTVLTSACPSRLSLATFILTMRYSHSVPCDKTRVIRQEHLHCLCLCERRSNSSSFEIKADEAHRKLLAVNVYGPARR